MGVCENKGPESRPQIVGFPYRIRTSARYPRFSSHKKDIIYPKYHSTILLYYTYTYIYIYIYILLLIELQYEGHLPKVPLHFITGDRTPGFFQEEAMDEFSKEGRWVTDSLMTK